METFLAFGLDERGTLVDVADDIEEIKEIEDIFTKVYFAPTTCPESPVLLSPLSVPESRRFDGWSGVYPAWTPVR